MRVTTLSSTDEKEEEKDIKELSHAERDQLKIEEARSKYGGKFGHEELYKALMFLKDSFQRSSVEWVVTGKLAEQMYALDLPVLQADKVEGVITRRNMSRSGISMFKTFLKDFDSEITEDSIKFDYMGVPVEINVVENDNKLYNNPDMRIYMTEVFKFPNPFSEYLKELE